MEYYIISKSADPSVIGVKNGMYQATFDKIDFKSIEEYEKFNVFFYKTNYFKKEEKFLDVDIRINNIHKLPKAKVTDVMGVSPFIPYVDFLISEKLKKIFDHFQIQKNLIFETNLIDSKEGLNYLYFFFYLPELNFETIILEKSELYTREIYFENSKKIIKDTIHKIKGNEHYKELKYSLLAPQFSKICISSAYQNLDLIDVGGYMFVSQTLKEEIERKDITGLNIGDRCELIFD